jgi:hypothetical protein
MIKFRVFVDLWPLSQDCRDHGAPSRVYIRTPRRHVTVKTGFPYRTFALVHRYSYANAAGTEVQVFESTGRRWARERPGWQVRETTWSSEG